VSTVILAFAISLIFSPIAALMAYLITYQEYARHVERIVARRHAFKIALAVFIMFMLFGSVSGLALNNIILKHLT
jgi:hypothetical protein